MSREFLKLHTCAFSSILLRSKDFNVNVVQKTKPLFHPLFSLPPNPHTFFLVTDISFYIHASLVVNIFFAFTLYCCSLKARSRHARDSSAIATQALFNDRRTTYLKLHWILWKMWDIFYYLKYIIKKSQISRQKMLILVHKSYWRVCMVDTVQGRHSEKSSRMCINHVYNVEFFFVSVSFTRTGMEVKSPSWRVKINVKCFYKFTRCSLPLIQLHHTISSSSSFSLSLSIMWARDFMRKWVNVNFRGVHVTPCVQCDGEHMNLI